jgi:ATP-dependent protease Clp ATPase subunit
MNLPYTKNAKTDFKKCSFCGRDDKSSVVLITSDEASICASCVTFANANLLDTVGIRYGMNSQFIRLEKRIGKFFALTIILFAAAASLFMMALFKH